MIQLAQVRQSKHFDEGMWTFLTCLGLLEAKYFHPCYLNYNHFLQKLMRSCLLKWLQQLDAYLDQQKNPDRL